LQKVSRIVSVSGLGTLTTVEAKYSLSGANSVSNQSVGLTVTNGNTSFEIPTSLLVNAILFYFTELVNTITGCSVAVSNVSKELLLMQFLLIQLLRRSFFCANEARKM
jgi:hypothetical protein